MFPIRPKLPAIMTRTWAPQPERRGSRSTAEAGAERMPEDHESHGQYAEPVTEGARPAAEEPTVQWLTPAELDSWLSVVRLSSWLPWSIDQQLRRDSNL